MQVLSVNTGSSSIKFALYDLSSIDSDRKVIFSGVFEGLELNGQSRLILIENEKKTTKDISLVSQERLSEAITYLKNYLQIYFNNNNFGSIDVIAHRVVHGGVKFKSSVSISDDVIHELTQLNSLAPLHQPFNIEGIRVLGNAYPGVPQVACFDTTFHINMPESEYEYALPKKIRNLGVRKYGFHGLSYQYVQAVLKKYSKKSQAHVVMAHLGNGASVAAVVNGVGLASSMGFSALDGLVMGTRCGELDPGVILFLLENGWTHDQIQQALYKESGLKGLSEISSDMRTIRASDSPQAQLAIDVFTRRVIKEIGALTASTGGLDVLAFTGGIGEHDAKLRSDVCSALSYLGVSIDEGFNQSVHLSDEASQINQKSSRVEVWVVPTDEGYVAAKEAAQLMLRQS